MSLDLDLDQYESVTVKIRGESRRVRLPSLDEQLELEAEVKKLTKKEDHVGIMKAMRGHYVSLGLDDDVVQVLNFVQLQKLGKLLSGVDSGK